MWEQDDGDTLEKGEMAHPLTGEIIPYEELWTDLDIDGPFKELGEEEKVCVVLMLDGSEDGAKGMVVRIGGMIQGVVRVGGKFDFGIWSFDSGKGEWEQTERLDEDSSLSAAASVLFQVRKTDGEFPSEGAFIDEGDEYHLGWQVVEKSFIGSGD